MRKFFIFFALIALSYITSAATMQEFGFNDLGYKDFHISGPGIEKCADFDFIYRGELNARAFEVLSLRAGFAPDEKSGAKIAVHFNGGKISELGSEDFANGIARVQMPPGKLREKNSVGVCAKTSSIVNDITVYADSKFGVYDGAFFPNGDGYKLELETYEPLAGVPFRVEAVASNYGTEDAYVTLSYRKLELERAAPEVSVLDGETTKSGTAPKCIEWNDGGTCAKPGRFGISYYVVAHKAVPFTLLPSVMRFTNIFGEEQAMLTNRPDLGAVEPPQKLSAKVALSNDKLYTGSEIPLKITVQNISRERVQNISISAKTGLELVGDGTKVAESLEPNQSQDAVFEVRGPAEGAYAVGCSVEYESRVLECETASVTLQKGIGVEIISSVLLALLAAAAFAYFYFRKA